MHKWKRLDIHFLVNDDHIFNCCNITNKKAYFAFYSLFTSTHVSAFHNFSELKCVFFLFMIVGINSNSCRNWKVHERKTKKKKYIEIEWGNKIEENESTGFHTQFYDSYKRSPHAKRYVTLSCWLDEKRSISMVYLYCICF